MRTGEEQEEEEGEGLGDLGEELQEEEEEVFHNFFFFVSASCDVEAAGLWIRLIPGFLLGFQFHQQMNGGGGGGGGGAFYSEGFAGFPGAAQMSSSAPQTSDRPTGSPLQQQLLQIGRRRRSQTNSLHVSLLLISVFPLAAASLNNRVSQIARQTAAALLQYCRTGDTRALLAIQTHLCSVQDTNGDT